MFLFETNLFIALLSDDNLLVSRYYMCVGSGVVVVKLKLLWKLKEILVKGSERDDILMTKVLSLNEAYEDKMASIIYGTDESWSRRTNLSGEKFVNASWYYLLILAWLMPHGLLAGGTFALGSKTGWKKEDMFFV